jgi:peptidoglycan hydrolase-like protein with peptidoglycan-binding domain
VSAHGKRRTLRVVTGSVTGVAVVAGVLVTGYTLTARPQAPASASDVPTRTVPVTRGTVSQRSRLSGTYGFAGSYSVIHQGSGGILTGTAAAGTIIGRGGVLYRVDGAAVHLFFGSTPAHRDFALGMADGPDVAQLESNLRALGLDPDHDITVDNHFSSATATAIRKLQKKWGLSWENRTGRLTFGTVVFLSGKIRVSKVDGTVGTSVHADQPVLTATGTGRVVSASLAANQQGQVKAGDKVTVTLPGTKPIEGTVVRVGKVATSDSDDNGNAKPATVELVIRIVVPKGAPDLDQATVQVMLASVVRNKVLIVPVSALLASPSGGYRVRLGSGAYADVKPGVYDDSTGNVEVTGVDEGDRVEVPEE